MVDEHQVMASVYSKRVKGVPLTWNYFQGKSDIQQTPGQTVAQEKPADISGPGKGQEEVTVAERRFIMSDTDTYGHQDKLASDYDYGMGSGRPAYEEGKGLFFGSEHGHHHHPKMEKLPDEAEHMLHMGEKHGEKDETHEAVQHDSNSSH